MRCEPTALLLLLAALPSGCFNPPASTPVDDEPGSTSDLPPLASSDDGTSSGSSGLGPVPSEDTTGTSGPSGTTTTAGSSSSESGGSTSLGFVMEPDFPEGDCDPWDQDCPAGFKCAPTIDGGTEWNALECVPLSDDPLQAGEPCTVEGSPGSGIDDCDLGSVCWDVDPATLEGTCISQCQGSPEAPWCGASSSCVMANEGVLNLCLPQCNPLLQACPAGQGCYPFDGSYICAPDASGGSAGPGTPCEYVNSCAPGLACIAADALELCDGLAGCCTPFCDVNDPGDPCPALAEDCYPMPEAPLGLEHVGLCALEP